MLDHTLIQLRTCTSKRATGLILKTSLAMTMVLFLSACLSSNQILVSKFEQEGLVAKETPRGVVIYLAYLPDVMFVFGSSTLSSEAERKIAFIARVSNDRLAIKRDILVEGHTDAVGSKATNIELSESRAKSASVILVENGVTDQRIETVWFGESQPLVPNKHSDGSDNPEGRAANRRVEFILLNP
ncbi:MAG: OmpA family protein [Proteobacteria bacterium]|nr:OmpA family protein [Pseudomonadota bacterium]